MKTNIKATEKAVPENFLKTLAEMHTAEKELTLALPLVAAAAKSPDLKALLEIHLTETKGHVKTIEAIAEFLKVELPKASCHAMTELIEEGVKVIAKRLVSPEQDAALIAVGRKIEQLEIAAYRALCAQAEKMDLAHVLTLLTSTLNQEELADELLAGLAKGGVPLKQLIEKTSLKKAGATAS